MNWRVAVVSFLIIVLLIVGLTILLLTCYFIKRKQQQDNAGTPHAPFYISGKELTATTDWRNVGLIKSGISFFYVRSKSENTAKLCKSATQINEFAANLLSFVVESRNNLDRHAYVNDSFNPPPYSEVISTLGAVPPEEQSGSLPSYDDLFKPNSTVTQ